MSNEIKILSDNYKVLNGDGGVLVEAPLFDMYYLLCEAAADAPTPDKVGKMKAAASKFNEEYGTEIGWGAATNLLNQLDEVVTSAKKN